MCKSNISLKSNIMLKSEVKKKGKLEYIPARLLISLFPEYKDVRTHKFLTPSQKEEIQNILFLASAIKDVE